MEFLGAVFFHKFMQEYSDYMGRIFIEDLSSGSIPLSRRSIGGEQGRGIEVRISRQRVLK